MAYGHLILIFQQTNDIHCDFVTSMYNIYHLYYRLLFKCMEKKVDDVNALFSAACRKGSLEKVEEKLKDTEVIDSY